MNYSSLLAAGGGPAPAENPLGTISVPPGVSNFNARVAASGVPGGADIGIIIFASNMIKLATIVAGIWVMFNFVTAAFDYITAGESKAHAKVKDKLTMSVLGLVVIVSAYTVAGLLGLIIFGDASYILNPKICGPDGC